MGTVELVRFRRALTTATGITSHDGDLWVVDDAGDELWRINPDNPSDDTSGVYGLVGDFDSALTSPQAVLRHMMVIYGSRLPLAVMNYGG